MCTMERNVAISVDLENDETIWVKNLKKKMDDTLLTVSRAKQATIFHVPDIIKATDRKAYEPKLVSLGPYHHDELRLREWDDKLKWHYLKKFLSRNPNKCLQYYLNLIKGLEDKARIAYSEEPNMNSNDFVQMLLLDCCFVIELLLLIQMEMEKEPEEEEMQKEMKSPRMQSDKKKQATTEKEEEGDPILRRWKWALPLLVHDVLMLENQLPLFVLESLLLEIAGQDISMDQLMLPFLSNFLLLENPSIREVSKASIGQCHHLLHLFHSCIIPKPEDRGDGGHRVFIAEQPPSVPCTRELREARVEFLRRKPKSFLRNFDLGSSISNVSKDSMKQYHHLLHLFHSCILPRQKDRGDGGHRIAIAEQPPPVPCARELRDARVKLVRKKAKAKEAVSFLDITFKRGKMEIPQLRIEDDTNSLFRNLIAFEQCYPDAGLHVTTYAWFMDGVIDTNMDVALLRQSDIIISGLGSDNEVALLFNNLCKEVMVDVDSCYLSGVLTEIEKHRDFACNSWLASLNHTYFQNPWACISLVAAILLFLLTITQTVFSVLGYFPR